MRKLGKKLKEHCIRSSILQRNYTRDIICWNGLVKWYFL